MTVVIWPSDSRRGLIRHMGRKAREGFKEYGHVLYRIYTEDANRKAVIRALQSAEFPALCDNRLPGFTLIPAVGYGEGQNGYMESSLLCDVLVPYSDETDEKMQKVAEDIRRENHDQTLLLIVRFPCAPEFVWKSEPPTVDDQGALQFAVEDQQTRLIAQLGIDGVSTTSQSEHSSKGKIVAAIGEWKKLLAGTDIKPHPHLRHIVIRKRAKKLAHAAIATT
jgi:hypothetical protein